MANYLPEFAMSTVVLAKVMLILIKNNDFSE